MTDGQKTSTVLTASSECQFQRFGKYSVEFENSKSVNNQG